MTFATDQLEQNQLVIAKQQYDQKSSLHTMRTSRFQFEPYLVMQTLRARIVGQDQALLEIEKLLKVVKADFNSPDRPLSVTLMLGPTGVGKTETVRLISNAIYGRPDAFCRIDMNTLAQEHYAAALTGAPPGYVGSKEGHTLFDIEAIQGGFTKPGIVLFDEIEKASNEVIRALLNVLETGVLKLTAGTKSIDFHNSMIFMTSNIGAKHSQARLKLLSKFPKAIQAIAKHCHQDEVALTQRALQHKFDPEFINRIDRILHYAPVKNRYLPDLVAIEIQKLNQRLQKQNRTIYLSPQARSFLTSDYEVGYGARGLARRIRTQIEPLLAEVIIGNPEISDIYVDLKQNKFHVEHLSVDDLRTQTSSTPKQALSQ